MTADEIREAFAREAASTRRVLERIPEGRTSFRPHAKSWTLGELGLHLANIPFWAVLTVERDELDLAPPGGPPFSPPRFESAAAALAMFDGNVARARDALAKADDAALARPWTLLHGGKVVSSLPRGQVLRQMVLDHTVHHRGQLTVYLRMCDVPVPAIYGPSADARG